MNRSTWERLKPLVAEAAERPAAERERFVMERCADPVLQREILDLLASPAPLSSIWKATALQPGAQVGTYRIEQKLGEGGMGEVYRAHDRSLGRDVALKVLPAALAADPDRVHRFAREAKALAALNHSNIAQVFGFERWDAESVLVMELVGGRTLKEVIEAGRAHRATAVDDALPIARQIASALEAAHEAGVIHRDLKPANVKVRDDGTVKILDFGLAKIFEPAGTSVDSADATTAEYTGTASGVILGTAGYMSPEQVRGRPVDRRTDIWAFGVVLFELLTGQRMFAGQTTSDRLAAVLRQDIPWERLPPTTPDRLRRLLERCLARDPTDRLRDAGDARIEIDDILAHPVEPVAVAGPAAAVPRRRRERVAWVTLSAAALAAGALGMNWWVGHDRQPAAAVWTQFKQLTNDVGEATWPAISPNGDLLAYASRAAGTWDIYVRRVGGSRSIVVAGDSTRDESAPAWSPDGQYIAFHEADSDGGIFIVGASGESPRRVTDSGFHPAWSPEGRLIAYCSERVLDYTGRVGKSALWVVPAAGGAPHKIYDGDAVQPAWSPDGTRIAFWGLPPSSTQRDLFTVPAGGGTAVAVTNDPAVDWSVTWAPDGRHLYFASNRGGAMNLWRIAIDEASGRAAGSPEAVTAGAQGELAMPSLSADGRTLVFQSLQVTMNPVVIPFDPETGIAGAPEYLFQMSGEIAPVSVSPDGKWLALNTLGRREDILISRTDGTGLRNLTDDAYEDIFPTWSPVEPVVTFASDRRDGSASDGAMGIWSIRPDGSHRHQVFERRGLQIPFYDQSTGRLWAFDMGRGHSVTLDGGDASGPQKGVDEPQILVDGGVFRPTGISRDGARLAGVVFANNNLSGIGWYDLRTGRGPRTWSWAEVQDAPAWLPDSTRLVYVRKNGDLVVRDTRTDQERVLRALPFNVSLFAPAVSPEGRSIFLGAQVRRGDIWMAERLR
jgi:Tol biopolymer transport system component/predicted Ser/Thr protein kinase